MFFEIKFKNLPAGYIVTVRENGEADVAVREFVSSEDGDHFIQRLEGFPAQVIEMLPAEVGISPGMIDRMLVILHSDKTAQVYINDFNMISTIRYGGKRNIKVGDPIYDDDILDIEKVSFEGVKTPEDAGILFVFSAGWRKGLFYDLTPILPSGSPRDFDLEILLGRYFSYLSYQHLFKLSENDWENLFSQQWFPFASLKTAICKQMLNRIKNQQQIDALLEKIAEEVKTNSEHMLAGWKSNPYFEPSFRLFEQAVERYLAEDYISATSILFHRIEGVLRHASIAQNPLKWESAPDLITHATQSGIENRHEHSLLLPLKFSEYLRDVYFANFSLGQPVSMSRNSLAHGIADAKDYSLKSATIGLLTLDQIFYFLSERRISG